MSVRRTGSRPPPPQPRGAPLSRAPSPKAVPPSAPLGSDFRASAVASPRTGLAILDDAHVGAFLGRIVSNVVPASAMAALDAVADRVEMNIPTAFPSAVQSDPDFAERAKRTKRLIAAAAVIGYARSGTPLGPAEQTLFDAIAAGDSGPDSGFAPPVSPRDGETEAFAFRMLNAQFPELAAAVVQNHPQIARASQLVATGTIADTIASEQGRVLEGFNVLTVMHQLGSTPGWLELMSNKLGLRKDQYLGVAVPYSRSDIAMARLNRDGWTTLGPSEEPPRGFGMLRPRYEKPFDTLKKEEILEGLQKMLELHERNHKPIIVVDDGGYVAQVLHETFPDKEPLFRFVEWTTRGIRQFEKLSHPGFPLISGAESRPKTEIEPAFIGAALAESFRAALTRRFGQNARPRVLLVGYGNIGKAAAELLREAGYPVSVFDKRPDRQKQARALRFPVSHSLEEALKGAQAVLATTGENSLPPSLLRQSPGLLLASASSVDIETRDPENPIPGSWHQDTKVLHVSIGNNADPSRSNLGDTSGYFADHLTHQYLDTLNDQLRKSGLNMKAEVQADDNLASGFVLNLDGRIRLMSLEREELVLMNVTEAISQAATTSSPGKHLMESRREDRILRVFAEKHPEDAKFAADVRSAVAPAGR
jgi:hypothetical protein